MGSYFYSTLHPEIYHGYGQKAPFFEGWYFKLVSNDETQRLAIIPGVILGENGHAFVQVLNGSTGKSIYYTFPIEEFQASKKVFDVWIGPNHFSKHCLELSLDSLEGRIQGTIRFGSLAPWPVSWFVPGIMGPFAWLPKMECYHGVVSLDHWLEGSLNVDGEALDFRQGRGYIEKDWGESFPAAWIWFQSNHFSTAGTCVTASVAIIPWMGSAFLGLIAGLWHQGKLYRFATYNAAHTEVLEKHDDHVLWIMRNLTHRLELLAWQAEGGLLKGPTRMDMGKRVPETMSATVDVRLTTLSGDLIFQGQGRNAGLEVFGELNLYQPGSHGRKKPREERGDHQDRG